MHYYKSNNEIMQYCSFSNDIALIMHYRALLKRSDWQYGESILSVIKISEVEVHLKCELSSVPVHLPKK